ncbi:cytochrome P450 [Geminocystis sp. NIES-3709]|uniref:cytochrome P450 n=1 Tax=Geminocystis sp. NIES-3709 TaxID=1617448 RepID=UPI0005FC830B|nr:cytochrome P450 [Geminocystis sp. NIES-3709]BAQ66208.1 cytochrome P450 [Geminocystis sp. NIES-3709]
MSQINPLTTSVIQQKIKWILDPVGYLKNAYNQHPDIFTATVSGLGSGSLVFVTHPQAIQQILTNDRQQFFANGQLNNILTPVVGFSSLLSLDGENHKRERKLLMPSFHGERMQIYSNLITEITENIFNQLKPGEVFIARELMQEISLQVIVKIVFGLSEGDRFEKMKELIKAILDRFNNPINISFLFYDWLKKDFGAWSPWGGFIRTRMQLDELIHSEINLRRQENNTNRTDILSTLLTAVDEEGKGMSDQELRDELMLMLFAGHETTAIAMTWTLYWLHRQPDIKTKLLTELSENHDRRGETIFKLPYLTAVCNETLRIHPVAMLTFPRQVMRDTELLDQKIPKDTVLLGCIYLTHHREDLYPEADKFIPERFLNRQYSPYEFMPFGGGVRRCLGEVLALYEMKLSIAHIITKYDLKLAENKTLKPKRRGVVLSPEGGVKMIFNEKKQ